MTYRRTVLISLPGFRPVDLPKMPFLKKLAEQGGTCPLIPSFPAVTCSTQISLSTGTAADEHGVIANGFYWRDQCQVEMWTAWNDVIQKPRIWDRLKAHDPRLTSAVWFPLLTKGTTADYACTFAPIHNPDGSESLWCYTKPTELYGELRDTFGHFPLKHFWGPLANIESSRWIVQSAIYGAQKMAPDFWFIYLPHLDYAAQKFGPDSEQAQRALTEIDAEIEKLHRELEQTGPGELLWLIAGEYAITPVSQVGYPNRCLRVAGMLAVEKRDDGEWIDFANTPAWALADHQLAHVFVKDESQIPQIAELFRQEPTVKHVLTGKERADFNLDHERSGEVVLLSQPDAWFAYYYWLDDDRAPGFARTIDIHRKPGYDPCEMFIDWSTKQTPLDPGLIKGSHGYPADVPERQAAFVCSDSRLLPAESIRDIDVADLVFRNFGIQ